MLNPLKAERLILKSLSPEDEADMIVLLRDPKIALTYMLPEFSSDEEAAKLFRRLLSLSISGEKLVYGIYEGGKVIGYLNEVQKEGESIEIGYLIDSRRWNQGYASEAFGRLIPELFRLGYHHVIAGYFEENLASKRVMEKCGMKPIDKTDTLVYRGIERRCFYYEIRG